MADLPNTSVKINDIQVSSDSPVTESLLKQIGGDINYLLDGYTRTITSTAFTASGSFTVPTGVTRVILFGCGGGGGGGYGDSGFVDGGGGSGAPLSSLILTVVPAAVITVTIGSGGAAGNNSDGGRGGTTSFGSLNFYGGYGGKRTTGLPGLGLGAHGGAANEAGWDSVHYVGGTNGGFGGAGGAGPFGNGANGTGGAGNSGGANTGAGGSGGREATSSLGGAGGSGYLIVSYYG
jgi:hypothetical protein